MLTRVLIPAAGLGKRFVEAGYTVPKPLIPVCGRPMLDYALQLAKTVDRSAPIVLCSHTIEQAVRRMQADVIPVRYAQQGSLLTLLCANGHVADDDEIIVMACDDIFQDYDLLQKFLGMMRNNRAVAGLVTTFLPKGNTSNQWCYVYGRDNIVNSITEKVPLVDDRVSCGVSCGIFYFNSWRNLRYSAMRAVLDFSTVHGEYYISAAIEPQRKRIIYYDIPAEQFATVGTPEQLKEYEAQHEVAAK